MSRSEPLGSLTEGNLLCLHENMEGTKTRRAVRALYSALSDRVPLRFKNASQQSAEVLLVCLDLAYELSNEVIE